MLSWQRGVSMWLKHREHRGCKVQRRVKREGGVRGVYERMCEAPAGTGETEAQGHEESFGKQAREPSASQSISLLKLSTVVLPLHPLPSPLSLFFPRVLSTCCVPALMATETQGRIRLRREQLSIVKVLKQRIKLHNNIGSCIMWTKMFLCVPSFSLLITAFTLKSGN